MLYYKVIFLYIIVPNHNKITSLSCYYQKDDDNDTNRYIDLIVVSMVSVIVYWILDIR